MTTNVEIPAAAVDELQKKLGREAMASGYHLNPDAGFTRDLVKGLLVNEERYGYPACPCRLAAGKKANDLDIICPCDYRDADLNEFGACFCALYVAQDVLEGQRRVVAIPERRPPASQRQGVQPDVSEPTIAGRLSQPVWRCKVCGYLCARGEAPDICPICKARKDRFEKFI
jgi:ferredoxin-thioredoxin reductase catalytic chain